jgi:hypothetical protein
MITGVSPVQYWGVIFICDCLTGTLLAVLLVGTICVVDIGDLYNGAETKCKL